MRNWWPVHDALQGSAPVKEEGTEQSTDGGVSVVVKTNFVKSQQPEITRRIGSLYLLILVRICIWLGKFLTRNSKELRVSSAVVFFSFIFILIKQQTLMKASSDKTLPSSQNWVISDHLLSNRPGFILETHKHKIRVGTCLHTHAHTHTV